MKSWKDSLGIAASALCAVHCAATPILLSTLPSLRLTGWMASPLFHQIAAGICIVFVAIAIAPTVYRKRDLRLGGLATLGVLLLLLAAFALPDSCCAEHHDSHAGHSHSISSVDNHAHDHLDESNVNVVEAGLGLGLDSKMLSAWIAMVQPWVTPLGGLLLVMAHILNHGRRPSGCGKKDCRCAENKLKQAQSLRTSTPETSLKILPAPTLVARTTQTDVPIESSELDLQRAC